MWYVLLSQTRMNKCEYTNIYLSKMVSVLLCLFVLKTTPGQEKLLIFFIVTPLVTVSALHHHLKKKTRE